MLSQDPARRLGRSSTSGSTCTSERAPTAERLRRTNTVIDITSDTAARVTPVPSASASRLVLSRDGVVIGSGSVFTADLYEGEAIAIAGTQYEVARIFDNTHLLLNRNAGVNASGLTLYRSPSFATTIAAYGTSSQVTLATPVPGSGSGSVAGVYGTDNASALQSAENVAGAVGGEVNFPAGIYVFGSTVSRESGTTWRGPRAGYVDDGTYRGAQLVWAGPQVAAESRRSTRPTR